MTDEEINRKFDVVAEHLAALAVGLQSLQETQRRAEERWERTEGSIRALLAAAEIQAGEIKELGESVRVVDERQRQSDRRAAETDERLNALINTVERYIIGRNGQG
jgi:chromosome segregation ATPase